MPRLAFDPEKTPPILISGKSMSENKTGNWRSIRPKIDTEKCTHCMVCWKFCPEACVDIKTGEPQISMGYCKGCAICADVCPVDCVEMVEEEAR